MTDRWGQHWYINNLLDNFFADLVRLAYRPEGSEGELRLYRQIDSLQYQLAGVEELMVEEGWAC